jgi:PAS domain S-box-containing protein
MKDQSKTKQALIQELASLRQRIAELEQSESERKRVDDLLHLHIEILAHMVESVHLVRVDDGVIVYTNPRFDSVFGYDPGELVGKHVSIVNAPGEKSPEDTANEIIKSLKQAGVWEGEVHNIRKDGISFWCHADVSTFKHPQYGEVWISVNRDITERKQAEEALRKSQEQLRNAHRLAHIGVWNWIADTDTVTWTEELYRIAGLDPMLPAPTYAEHSNIYTPESWGRLKVAVEKALETGAPYQLELELIRPDVTTRWVNAFGGATHDNNGRVMGLYGTLHDISDRKRAEEALRESESLSKSLIDYMHDAMIILDWDGSILFANLAAAKIIEFERPEEFVGHNMIEYLHPDSFQKAAEDLEAVKADKMGFLSEYQLCSVTGRRLWVESLGGKIIFRNASANLVCIRDITERKRVEEALRESEEKYRGILENMDDAYYELDLNGNLVFFNEALILKTGYSREELMGMNYEQYISPETRKQVSRVFSELYKTGQPASLFDYEVIMKGGQKRNYESWANLLFDNNNQPIGFRGIARDITKRKVVEEELSRTLESLRKAVGATIQVMVSAVEARDPYTAGHQIRSADLARAIATEMGLPPEKIDGIRMAGSIHDIGKLSIPAEILSKPTKLTEIEFSLIKEHSRSGYEMLKDVESPWPLAQIIYQHHERMDGSGYPRNLKGDDILIEARILAVADVVESMASHRPYRPSLGIDAALEEIEKNRGTLYDDAVADACLRLFREKGYQLQ